MCPLFPLPSFACPPTCPAPLPPRQPLRARAKKYVCHKGGGRVCFSEGGHCAASEKESIGSYWLLQVGARSHFTFHTLLLREKKGSRQFTVPKGTDRVFLRYWFGKYQEIPTKYRSKIPKLYTTLMFSSCNTSLPSHFSLNKIVVSSHGFVHDFLCNSFFRERNLSCFPLPFSFMLSPFHPLQFVLSSHCMQQIVFEKCY